MPTTKQPDLLLSPLLPTRDAAHVLAVSQRTLWGLTAPRGPIPCVRIGRRVLYSPADLQAFTDKQKQRSEAE